MFKCISTWTIVSSLLWSSALVQGNNTCYTTYPCDSDDTTVCKDTYPYKLTIEVTPEARKVIADLWDSSYSLQIYKGWTKTGSNVGELDFNVVWDAIPKHKLQSNSGTQVLQFGNPVKVQFWSSNVQNDIIDDMKSSFSCPMNVGQTTTFGDTGDWSNPEAFSNPNKLRAQNRNDGISKAVLFSESTIDGVAAWKPFHISTGIIPGSELIGSPVLKLGFAFGATVKGTFVGQIQSIDVDVVDFTMKAQQNICIKVKDGTREYVLLETNAC